MTELLVHVENRPGTLAAITELLGVSGVNIEALAAYGHNGDGVLRLIVDDAAGARRALRQAGLKVEEREVLTTRLSHEPGALAAVTRRLADAEVNIDALYVLATSADGIEVAIAVEGATSVLAGVEVNGAL